MFPILITDLGGGGGTRFSCATPGAGRPYLVKKKKYSGVGHWKSELKKDSLPTPHPLYFMTNP